jgi:hypothetical protein
MAHQETIAPSEKEWDVADNLVNAVDNVAAHVAEYLCELARIPEACRSKFRNAVRGILFSTIKEDIWNIRGSNLVPPEIIAGIDEFETAIRRAYNALRLLPEDWRRDRLCFWPPPPDELTAEAVASAHQNRQPWEDVLQRMVVECSELTGRPRGKVDAKRGRGRRKGAATRDTYPLRNLVWKLARTVRRYGGRLTLDAKKQKGTWIDALSFLQPSLRCIPRALPLSMIQEVQTKANKVPL